MNATPEIELADYVQLVFRRKLVVGLVFAATVALALLFTASQTPMYQATAQVLVEPSTNVDVVGAQATTTRADRARDLANEVVFAESDRVVNAVRAQVGADSPVEISANPDSDVLQFSALSDTPETSQMWANAHADAYVTERLSEATETYLAATSLVQEELDVVRRQMRFGADPDSAAMVTLVAQEARLVEALRDLGLVDRLSAVGQAQVTSLAELPSSPASPNWLRNIAAGVIVAGLFGIGAALSAEALDRTIRSKEQVQLATGHLPLLGSVPRPTKRRSRKPTNILPTLQTPGFLEAIRSLRSSIRIARVAGDGFNTVLVTSSGPGEGKSTTAANLALSFARSGVHTVIVDLDMRSPTIHKLLGLSNKRGISDAVLGANELHPRSEKATGGQLVDVVTAGYRPSDPVDVASSPDLEKIIHDLSFVYDLVIVDSPPVLPVSDTLALSRVCDATILVARAGQTKTKDLSETLDALERSGASVLGTVLTGDTTESKRYGYGYGDAAFGETASMLASTSTPKKKLRVAK